MRRSSGCRDRACRAPVRTRSRARSLRAVRESSGALRRACRRQGRAGQHEARPSPTAVAATPSRRSRTAATPLLSRGPTCVIGRNPPGLRPHGWLSRMVVAAGTPLRCGGRTTRWRQRCSNGPKSSRWSERGARLRRPGDPAAPRGARARRHAAVRHAPQDVRRVRHRTRWRRERSSGGSRAEREPAKAKQQRRRRRRRRPAAGSAPRWRMMPIIELCQCSPGHGHGDGRERRASRRPRS